MSKASRFSADTQRYLDDAGPAPVDAAERASAERLQRAVAEYALALRAPGPEVDRAVMHWIEANEVPARSGWWSWLVSPHVVRVRPVVLALAAALTLIVWWQVRAPVVLEGGQPTVLVRFQLAAPDAHAVSLAGSFNGWNAPGIPLRRGVVPGLWVVTLPLPVGEHQYLFRVDDTQWISDPAAHAQVDDGFGRTNSVLVVGPRGVAGP
jgi:hypothetical protein